MEEEKRLLIIGKTGNGKSALCNTIMGKHTFPTGMSMSSTTLTPKEATVRKDRIILKIVDTPDVTNLEIDQQKMEMEIEAWKILTRPHPTAILIAIRCDVRYTAEEYAVYREFLRLWGDDSLKSRLVVAFTFGDRQDGDIEEELRTVCPELQSVLRDAGGRYVVFNNVGNVYVKEAAVAELLEKLRILDREAGTEEALRKRLDKRNVLVRLAVLVLVLVFTAAGVLMIVLLGWIPAGAEMFVAAALVVVVYVACILYRYVTVPRSEQVV